MDELHSPEYVGHMPVVPGAVGREALRALMAAYYAAVDFHGTLDFLIAEGDMVVMRETHRGKHIGEFQGIPPTGKEVTVATTDIYRFADGKIAEQWTEWDTLGLMQQLGVVPKLGQGRG